MTESSIQVSLYVLMPVTLSKHVRPKFGVVQITTCDWILLSLFWELCYVHSYCSKSISSWNKLFIYYSLICCCVTAGFLAMGCSVSQTLKVGNIEGGCMILLSRRGKLCNSPAGNIHHSITRLSALCNLGTLDLCLIYPCSYLKSLVPSFNECVDQFLARLRPLADGKTQVSMSDHFANLALEVIGKVYIQL